MKKPGFKSTALTILATASAITSSAAMAEEKQANMTEATEACAIEVLSEGGKKQVLKSEGKYSDNTLLTTRDEQRLYVEETKVSISNNGDSTVKSTLDYDEFGQDSFKVGGYTETIGFGADRIQPTELKHNIRNPKKLPQNIGDRFNAASNHVTYKSKKIAQNINTCVASKVNLKF